MDTKTLSSKKDLLSAWMVLRLSIRTAATQYARQLLQRASALGAEPQAPTAIEELVRRLGTEVARKAAGDESSPTLRFLKSTFQPNEAERERRSLEKAFSGYLRLWREQRSQ